MPVQCGRGGVRCAGYGPFPASPRRRLPVHARHNPAVLQAARVAATRKHLFCPSTGIPTCRAGFGCSPQPQHQAVHPCASVTRLPPAAAATRRLLLLRPAARRAARRQPRTMPRCRRRSFDVLVYTAQPRYLRSLLMQGRAAADPFTRAITSTSPPPASLQLLRWRRPCRWRAVS